MLAASSGDPHLVNTLIEFDARVEDSDRDGNTAIFYAKNKKKVKAFVGICTSSYICKFYFRF